MYIRTLPNPLPRIPSAEESFTTLSAICPNLTGDDVHDIFMKNPSREKSHEGQPITYRICFVQFKLSVKTMFIFVVN